MIFAPTATLRFFNRFLSTDARIRGTAVAVAPLAVALIALPLGEGEVAGILRVVGWLWRAVTLWLLADPGLARGVLDYFESSADEAIVRMIGVVAGAIRVRFLHEACGNIRC